MNINIIGGEVSTKEILYVYLLLCLSGNQFFPEFFTEWIYIIVAVFLFFTYQNKLFSDHSTFRKFKNWIIGFLVLFIAQFIFISQVSIPADINFIAKFSIAFMIPCILGVKFRNAYLKAITFTAVVSLIFFSLYYFTGWHTGISFGRNNSILIYNQLLSDEPRNSGMFWEPGAFQAYINLVPLMFYNELKQLWKRERFSCIILILALITTFSTTGYVVFLFIIGTALIKTTHNKFFKAIIGVAVFAIVVYSFTSLDFIGEKISEQYENALTIEKGDVSWTRFGAAMVDSYEIARNPITGNGFLMDARYPGLGELMSGSGNGFTGALNMFGIIIILFYIIQLYKSTPGILISDKLIFAVAVILILQGEYLLNYSMFWALLFIKYPSFREEFM